MPIPSLKLHPITFASHKSNIVVKYGNALTTDKVMVVTHNPLKRESIYLTKGATRADLSQTVIIPNSYAGDELQVFISFMNTEESQLSNSIYIGSGTAS